MKIALAAALAAVTLAGPASAGDTANQVIASILGFNFPAGLVVDSKRGRVFVASLNDSAVKVIDERTDTVIATIAVLNTPFDMAIDPFRGKVFAANYFDNRGFGSNPSVIDEATDTLSASIPMPVPGLVTKLAVDPLRGEVYVGVEEGVAAADRNPNGLKDDLRALRVYDPFDRQSYLSRETFLSDWAANRTNHRVRIALKSFARSYERTCPAIFL